MYCIKAAQSGGGNERRRVAEQFPVNVDLIETIQRLASLCDGVCASAGDSSDNFHPRQCTGDAAIFTVGPQEAA